MTIGDQDPFHRLAIRNKGEDLIAPLWFEEGQIFILDQTKLPFEHHKLRVENPYQLSRFIKEMRIRGSGAIGCAGAIGACLAVHSKPQKPEAWEGLVKPLRESRPTALILQYAIDQVLGASRGSSEPLDEAAQTAVAFIEEQLAFERAIGQFGAKLIPEGATILTHCHSGALAGAGYGGRAISPIRSAHEAGKSLHVISLETRPYLQGARITMWELEQLGIPATLATDNMAGALMQMGKVDVCVVGSDRLAINGDLVNKIGTYLIALAAKEHNIPFYTATTHYNVDPNSTSGKDIPIELRPAEEVLVYREQSITVGGASAIYPGFDITPAKLLSGIITETGVIIPPFKKKLFNYVNRHGSKKCSV